MGKSNQICQSFPIYFPLSTGNSIMRVLVILLLLKVIEASIWLSCASGSFSDHTKWLGGALPIPSSHVSFPSCTCPVSVSIDHVPVVGSIYIGSNVHLAFLSTSILSFEDQLMFSFQGNGTVTFASPSDFMSNITFAAIDSSVTSSVLFSSDVHFSRNSFLSVSNVLFSSSALITIDTSSFFVNSIQLDSCSQLIVNSIVHLIFLYLLDSSTLVVNSKSISVDLLQMESDLATIKGDAVFYVNQFFLFAGEVIGQAGSGPFLINYLFTSDAFIPRIKSRILRVVNSFEQRSHLSTYGKTHLIIHRPCVHDVFSEFILVSSDGTPAYSLVGTLQPKASKVHLPKATFTSQAAIIIPGGVELVLEHPGKFTNGTQILVTGKFLFTIAEFDTLLFENTILEAPSYVVSLEFSGLGSVQFCNSSLQFGSSPSFLVSNVLFTGSVKINGNLLSKSSNMVFHAVTSFDYTNDRNFVVDSGTVVVDNHSVLHFGSVAINSGVLDLRSSITVKFYYHHAGSRVGSGQLSASAGCYVTNTNSDSQMGPGPLICEGVAQFNTVRLHDSSLIIIRAGTTSTQFSNSVTGINCRIIIEKGRSVHLLHMFAFMSPEHMTLPSVFELHGDLVHNSNPSGGQNLFEWNMIIHGQVFLHVQIFFRGNLLLHGEMTLFSNFEVHSQAEVETFPDSSLILRDDAVIGVNGRFVVLGLLNGLYGSFVVHHNAILVLDSFLTATSLGSLSVQSAAELVSVNRLLHIVKKLTLRAPLILNSDLVINVDLQLDCSSSQAIIEGTGKIIVNGKLTIVSTSQVHKKLFLEVSEFIVSVSGSLILSGIELVLHVDTSFLVNGVLESHGLSAIGSQTPSLPALRPVKFSGMVFVNDLSTLSLNYDVIAVGCAFVLSLDSEIGFNKYSVFQRSNFTSDFNSNILFTDNVSLEDVLFSDSIDLAFFHSTAQIFNSLLFPMSVSSSSSTVVFKSSSLISFAPSTSIYLNSGTISTYSPLLLPSISCREAPEILSFASITIKNFQVLDSSHVEFFVNTVLQLDSGSNAFRMVLKGPGRTFFGDDFASPLFGSIVLRQHSLFLLGCVDLSGVSIDVDGTSSITVSSVSTDHPSVLDVSLFQVTVANPVPSLLVHGHVAFLSTSLDSVRIPFHVASSRNSSITISGNFLFSHHLTIRGKLFIKEDCSLTLDGPLSLSPYSNTLCDLTSVVIVSGHFILKTKLYILGTFLSTTDSVLSVVSTNSINGVLYIERSSPSIEISSSRFNIIGTTNRIATVFLPSYSLINIDELVVERADIHGFNLFPDHLTVAPDLPLTFNVTNLLTVKMVKLFSTSLISITRAPLVTSLKNILIDSSSRIHYCGPVLLFEDDVNEVSGTGTIYFESSLETGAQGSLSVQTSQSFFEGAVDVPTLTVSFEVHFFSSVRSINLLLSYCSSCTFHQSAILQSTHDITLVLHNSHVVFFGVIDFYGSITLESSSVFEFVAPFVELTQNGLSELTGTVFESFPSSLDCIDSSIIIPGLKLFIDSVTLSSCFINSSLDTEIDINTAIVDDLTLSSLDSKLVMRIVFISFSHECDSLLWSLIGSVDLHLSSDSDFSTPLNVESFNVIADCQYNNSISIHLLSPFTFSQYTESSFSFVGKFPPVLFIANMITFDLGSTVSCDWHLHSSSVFAHFRILPLSYVFLSTVVLVSDIHAPQTHSICGNLTVDYFYLSSSNIIAGVNCNHTLTVNFFLSTSNVELSEVDIVFSSDANWNSKDDIISFSHPWYFVDQSLTLHDSQINSDFVFESGYLLVIGTEVVFTNGFHHNSFEEVLLSDKSRLTFEGPVLLSSTVSFKVLHTTDQAEVAFLANVVATDHGTTLNRIDFIFLDEVTSHFTSINLIDGRIFLHNHLTLEGLTSLTATSVDIPSGNYFHVFETDEVKTLTVNTQFTGTGVFNPQVMNVVFTCNSGEVLHNTVLIESSLTSPSNPLPSLVAQGHCDLYFDDVVAVGYRFYLKSGITVHLNSVQLHRIDVDNGVLFVNSATTFPVFVGFSGVLMLSNDVLSMAAIFLAGGLLDLQRDITVVSSLQLESGVFQGAQISTTSLSLGRVTDHRTLTFRKGAGIIGTLSNLSLNRVTIQGDESSVISLKRAVPGVATFSSDFSFLGSGLFRLFDSSISFDTLFTSEWDCFFHDSNVNINSLAQVVFRNVVIVGGNVLQYGLLTVQTGYFATSHFSLFYQISALSVHFLSGDLNVFYVWEHNCQEMFLHCNVFLDSNLIVTGTLVTSTATIVDESGIFTVSGSTHFGSNTENLYVEKYLDHSDPNMPIDFSLSAFERATFSDCTLDPDITSVPHIDGMFIVQGVFTVKNSITGNGVIYTSSLVIDGDNIFISPVVVLTASEEFSTTISNSVNIPHLVVRGSLFLNFPLNFVALNSVVSFEIPTPSTIENVLSFGSQISFGSSITISSFISILDSIDHVTGSLSTPTLNFLFMFGSNVDNFVLNINNQLNLLIYDGTTFDASFVFLPSSSGKIYCLSSSACVLDTVQLYSFQNSDVSNVIAVGVFTMNFVLLRSLCSLTCFSGVTTSSLTMENANFVGRMDVTSNAYVLLRDDVSFSSGLVVFGTNHLTLSNLGVISLTQSRLYFGIDQNSVTFPVLSSINGDSSEVVFYCDVIFSQLFTTIVPIVFKGHVSMSSDSFFTRVALHSSFTYIGEISVSTLTATQLVITGAISPLTSTSFIATNGMFLGPNDGLTPLNKFVINGGRSLLERPINELVITAGVVSCYSDVTTLLVQGGHVHLVSGSFTTVEITAGELVISHSVVITDKLTITNGIVNIINGLSLPKLVFAGGHLSVTGNLVVTSVYEYYSNSVTCVMCLLTVSKLEFNLNHVVLSVPVVVLDSIVVRSNPLTIEITNNVEVHLNRNVISPVPGLNLLFFGHGSLTLSGNYLFRDSQVSISTSVFTIAVDTVFSFENSEITLHSNTWIQGSFFVNDSSFLTIYNSVVEMTSLVQIETLIAFNSSISCLSCDLTLINEANLSLSEFALSRYANVSFESTRFVLEDSVLTTDVDLIMVNHFHVINSTILSHSAIVLQTLSIESGSFLGSGSVKCTELISKHSSFFVSLHNHQLLVLGSFVWRGGVINLVNSVIFTDVNCLFVIDLVEGSIIGDSSSSMSVSGSVEIFSSSLHIEISSVFSSFLHLSSCQLRLFASVVFDDTVFLSSSSINLISNHIVTFNNDVLGSGHMNTTSGMLLFCASLVEVPLFIDGGSVFVPYPHHHFTEIIIDSGGSLTGPGYVSVETSFIMRGGSLLSYGTLHFLTSCSVQFDVVSLTTERVIIFDSNCQLSIENFIFEGRGTLINNAVLTFTSSIDFWNSGHSGYFPFIPGIFNNGDVIFLKIVRIISNYVGIGNLISKNSLVHLYGGSANELTCHNSIVFVHGHFKIAKVSGNCNLELQASGSTIHLDSMDASVVLNVRTAVFLQSSSPQIIGKISTLTLSAKVVFLSDYVVDVLSHSMGEIVISGNILFKTFEYISGSITGTFPLKIETLLFLETSELITQLDVIVFKAITGGDMNYQLTDFSSFIVPTLSSVEIDVNIEFISSSLIGFIVQGDLSVKGSIVVVFDSLVEIFGSITCFESAIVFNQLFTHGTVLLHHSHLYLEASYSFSGLLSALQSNIVSKSGTFTALATVVLEESEFVLDEFGATLTINCPVNGTTSSIIINTGTLIIDSVTPAYIGSFVISDTASLFSSFHVYISFNFNLGAKISGSSELSIIGDLNIFEQYFFVENSQLMKVFVLGEIFLYNDLATSLWSFEIYNNFNVSNIINLSSSSRFIISETSTVFLTSESKFTGGSFINYGAIVVTDIASFSSILYNYGSLSSEHAIVFLCALYSYGLLYLHDTVTFHLNSVISGDLFGSCRLSFSRGRFTINARFHNFVEMTARSTDSFVTLIDLSSIFTSSFSLSLYDNSITFFTSIPDLVTSISLFDESKLILNDDVTVLNFIHYSILSGPKSLTVTQSFEYSSLAVSELTGSLILRINDTLSFGNYNFYSGTLVLDGNFVFTSSVLSLSYPAVLVNYGNLFLEYSVSGLFIAFNDTSRPAVFINHGRIEVDSAANVTITTPFLHEGELHVYSGSLVLSDSFDAYNMTIQSNGVFFVHSGATLVVSSSKFSVDNIFKGYGSIIFSYDTETIASSVIYHPVVGTFDFTGDIFFNTGPFSVAHAEASITDYEVLDHTVLFNLIQSFKPIIFGSRVCFLSGTFQLSESLDIVYCEFDQHSESTLIVSNPSTVVSIQSLLFNSANAVITGEGAISVVQTANVQQGVISVSHFSLQKSVTFAFVHCVDETLFISDSVVTSFTRSLILGSIFNFSNSEFILATGSTTLLLPVAGVINLDCSSKFVLSGTLTQGSSQELFTLDMFDTSSVFIVTATGKVSQTLARLSINLNVVSYGSWTLEKSVIEFGLTNFLDVHFATGAISGNSQITLFRGDFLLSCSFDFLSPTGNYNIILPTTSDNGSCVFDCSYNCKVGFLLIEKDRSIKFDGFVHGESVYCHDCFLTGSAYLIITNLYFDGASFDFDSNSKLSTSYFHLESVKPSVLLSGSLEVKEYAEFENGFLKFDDGNFIVDRFACVLINGLSQFKVSPASSSAVFDFKNLIGSNFISQFSSLSDFSLGKVINYGSIEVHSTGSFFLDVLVDNHGLLTVSEGSLYISSSWTNHLNANITFLNDAIFDSDFAFDNFGVLTVDNSASLVYAGTYSGSSSQLPSHIFIVSGHLRLYAQALFIGAIINVQDKLSLHGSSSCLDCVLISNSATLHFSGISLSLNGTEIFLENFSRLSIGGNTQVSFASLVSLSNSSLSFLGRSSISSFPFSTISLFNSSLFLVTDKSVIDFDSVHLSIDSSSVVDIGTHSLLSSIIFNSIIIDSESLFFLDTLVSVSVNNLTLLSGVVNGSSEIVVRELFLWESGLLTSVDSLSTQINGIATFSSSSMPRILLNHNILVNGTLAIRGNLLVEESSIIIVTDNGELFVQNHEPNTVVSVFGTGLVDNHGTISFISPYSIVFNLSLTSSSIISVNVFSILFTSHLFLSSSSELTIFGTGTSVFSSSSVLENSGQFVVNSFSSVFLCGNVSSLSSTVFDGSLHFINASVSKFSLSIFQGNVFIKNFSQFLEFNLASDQSVAVISDYALIDQLIVSMSRSSLLNITNNVFINSFKSLAMISSSMTFISEESIISSFIDLKLYFPSSLLLNSSSMVGISFDSVHIGRGAVLNVLMDNISFKFITLSGGTLSTTKDLVIHSAEWFATRLICVASYFCSTVFIDHLTFSINRKLIINQNLLLSNTYISSSDDLETVIDSINSTIILPSNSVLTIDSIFGVHFVGINSVVYINGLFKVDDFVDVFICCKFVFSETASAVLSGNIVFRNQSEVFFNISQSNLMVSSLSCVTVSGVFTVPHFNWNSGHFSFTNSSVLQTSDISCSDCVLLLESPSILNNRLDFIYLESSSVIFEQFDYLLEIELFVSNLSNISILDSIAFNFSNSFECFSSGVNVHSLKTQLFLYNFESVDSMVSFSTDFPVIAKSFMIDSWDNLISSDEIVVVDQIFTQKSLSPVSECCQTKNCLIEFYLTGAHVLDYFASFFISNSLEAFTNFNQNSLTFSLQHLYSYSHDNEFLVVSVNVAIISYKSFIEIPICPLVLDNLVASTDQSLVTLTGSNFGTFPLMLISSSLPIVSSFLPFDHSFISLLLADGAGCGHWIELQRPTDTSKSRIDFCFEPPFISFINPNPFPLTGLLEIHGSGFHWKHTVFNFSDADVELRSFEMTSSLIILDVISVCSPVSDSVFLSLIVMEQESNWIEIPLRFPESTITPPFLSRRVNSLKFTGNNLQFIFNSNCFAKFAIAASEPVLIEFSFSSANSADLVFINHLAFQEIPVYLYLNEYLWTSLTVPVASFLASAPDYTCLINSDCYFVITNFADEFDLNLFNVVVGPSVTLISSTSTPNTITISVIPRRPGLLELELCNIIACVPVVNLPVIAEIILYHPRNIQWMNISSHYLIALIGTGFDQSSLNQWLKTIKFDGCFEIQSIDSNQILLQVFINESKVFTVSFASYTNLGQNCLEILVSNFVYSNPIVPRSWILTLYSSVFVPDVFVYSGTISFKITSGANSVVAPNFDSSILLASNSNFLTVSKVFGSPIINIPRFVQYGTIVNSFISLEYLSSFNLLLNSSVVCISGCSLLNQKYEDYLLSFNFFVPDISNAELLVSFHYFEAKFSHQFFVTSVSPPVFEFPFSFVSVSSGLNLTFTGLFDSFCLDSVFYIDDVILGNFGQFDCFTVMRSCKCQYLINLSSFSFNYGESIVKLFWQSLTSGFEPILISEFTVFNGNFVTNDYLSLFKSSDISFYLPNVSEGYLCVVNNQKYKSKIIDDFLVFPNVSVSSYQPLVAVSILKDDFLITSLEIPVEAVLEEICFVQQRIIPLIPSSNFYMKSNHVTYFPSIIFDGNRCCSRSISDCSVQVHRHTDFSINFDQPFDLTSFIITVNSSCSLDTSSILTFPNIDSNISHCETIPNGFSFALMCEFELNSTLEVLDFVFLQPFYLLELEFYGFPSNFCYKLFDYYSGLGFFGLPILLNNSLIKVDNQFFSNYDHLLNYTSKRIIDLIKEKSIIIDCFIVNNDCFIPELPYLFEYFLSPPRGISLLNSVIPLQSKLIVLEVACVDDFGFVIPCISLTVYSTSFKCSSVNFSSSLIQISLDSIIFGNHSLSVSLDDVLFDLFFTIVQTPGDFLDVSSVSVIPCDDSVSGYFSCSLVTFDLFYITVFEFYNEPLLIDLNTVDFVFNNDVAFWTRLGNDSILIHSLPFLPVKFDISFSNLIFSLEILSANCSSKTLVNEKCFCDLGHFFQSGQCFPCPFSTFIDSYSQSSCTPCNWPRVTSTVGSSSKFDCHCPTGHVDVKNSCQACPKYVKCSNGTVESVIDGVLFNSALGHITHCPLKFLCEKNSCRYNFVGSSCTSCDGNCFSQQHVLLNVFFFVLLVGFLFLVDNLLNYYRRKAVAHRILVSKFSVNSHGFNNLLKSIPICPVLLLICISLVFTGTISGLSLSLRFSLGLFSFDRFHVLVRVVLLFIGVILCWHDIEFKSFSSIILVLKRSCFFTIIAFVSVINSYSIIIDFFYNDGSFSLSSIVFDCLLFLSILLLQLETCFSIPTVLFAVLTFLELFGLIHFWIVSACFLVLLIPFYSKYNQLLLFFTTLFVIFRISFLVF
ncbi:hypothetical protein RCL1_004593 [Eukaryota sp. TZLM3-RCL]